jgi:acetone carboxylase alpha subunit
VLADIHDGYVLPRHAEDAYGVVVEQVGEDAKHNSAIEGEFAVDEAATAELREEMMAERAEEAVPVSEWYDRERDRIREGGFIDDVKKTYESSMRMSRQFTDFFTSFWELSDGFEFELSDTAEKSLEYRFGSGFKRKWDNPTKGHESWTGVGREDEPLVPYTWTDRSLKDLSGPSATFGERPMATDDD